MLSVLLCTHNPREAFLKRTLDALRAQTLPFTDWEFILIDNASEPAVVADLSWHPQSRVVREDKVGLTEARIRAIAESKGDLLIFVDDDNLLAPDYLQRALEIDRQWPILGTWGGQCIPEFEVEPPEWTREFWNWIAIRQFDQDRWSNLPVDSGATPCGAGMCVRRHIAETYLHRIQNDPVRRALDRTGRRLLGGGDTDLCLTACDVGMGNGIFQTLRLTHLIPARRLEESYLLELVEAMICSSTLLRHFRGETISAPSRSQRLLRWYESLRLPARERRFEEAKRRGHESAVREIVRARGNPSNPSPTVS